MPAAVTRTVPRAGTRLRRAWVALLCGYCRFRIRAAAEDVAHMQADYEALPMRLAAHRHYIEALRCELAQLQAAAP